MQLPQEVGKIIFCNDVHPTNEYVYPEIVVIDNGNITDCKAVQYAFAGAPE